MSSSKGCRTLQPCLLSQLQQEDLKLWTCLWQRLEVQGSRGQGWPVGLRLPLVHLSRVKPHQQQHQL
jgi:hypothetical protein